MSQPNIKISTHRAFLLLDAVMGIFVCVCGFALAFGFLSIQNLPKPSIYMSYKALLLSPNISTATLHTRSNPRLVYEGKIHSTTESNFTFFAPTHIH